jgi:hypothetical protein
MPTGTPAISQTLKNRRCRTYEAPRYTRVGLLLSTSVDCITTSVKRRCCRSFHPLSLGAKVGLELDSFRPAMMSLNRAQAICLVRFYQPHSTSLLNDPTSGAPLNTPWEHFPKLACANHTKCRFSSGKSRVVAAISNRLVVRAVSLLLSNPCHMLMLAVPTSELRGTCGQPVVCGAVNVIHTGHDK